MSQFQLFPPPAPQGVPKNPFRKGPRRPSVSTQSSVSSPLEDPRGKGAEAKAVVLQVVEPSSIKPSRKAHIPPPSPRSSTPEARPGSRSPESISKASPEEQNVSSPLPDDNKLLSPARTNGDGESGRAQNPAPVAASPIVPMRSIFPRFNPDAPLGQQQYCNGVSQNFSRPRTRPAELDLSQAPEIDRALGPKTVPASVLDFPAGLLDPVDVVYSSTAELRGLWEAANGQRPEGIGGNFSLRMQRLDAATFVFGEANAPFYTMQTYSTDELSISRTNPSNPNTKISIMMLQLEDRRRREPPDDGLVSHLFSQLAAMLAIEQAEELARQHRLPLLEAAEVEADALKRAAAQESCRLSWNPTKRLYELQHPSLSKQAPSPALVGAAGMALSPVRSKYSGVLHITVSTPSANPTAETAPGRAQPPTILVTAPLPNSSIDAAASPRTSTLPLTDTDEPLASLDLGTMTLTISTPTITNTIPSLYAIDSIVAAILAVAVSDAATNPVLADTPLYNPHNNHSLSPQPQPQPQYPRTPTTPFTGKLVATIAEREDAQAGTDLISRIKSAASPSLDRQTKPAARFNPQKWLSLPFPRSAHSTPTHLPQPERRSKRAKRQPPPSTGISIPMVAEEFDLEKYGRYGTGSSREGEEVPGAARGAIKLLFWGLKLVVFALTVVFKVLSWVLVAVARCLTSEKL
ncbi:hypothetical protein P175DRAFT_0508411 [Aspergillus ochraceoroseus IBT 24754]|uniref:Proline-rich protein n=2 Tax=Aspergillus ochraceoroseus TaxID=138278 RepID=A0A2T5LYT5_9EURO|nr:uncharacterized protein P175DRAFT_0508411 [Aspergillus ochraceoroseus IBT 24754]KKK21554.1 hypothetical protein AOCH_006758 [Aspergillus ochraceoroseus]PTU21436.1 hypothetical protein P175DRAFT_0508411 [Aspergillus ochraceoroseus IBT 24754]